MSNYRAENVLFLGGSISGPGGGRILRGSKDSWKTKRK